ncbi:MAG: isoprenyl transferase [Oleispira antarctica]|uniref:Ditrans,polycis-undecaprenyl-diphosphate synthase ((2E,6E)-farnesyl-diphosphate specific) n=1 Tax=Oleispira antarctica RB-8 TaxID=698738 RepID=R4YKR3_OLEAN|nr:isoprenyl transferase [Oleispira antarctica]MBQ0791590.1 isoprenyl transferase [Oleispira antarctica]CCK75196.1 Undecaprenyl diphosphate synthase [Oleispira antarctica RB-8]
MSTSISENTAVEGGVPRHVAVIMDGNNRWAKKRLMPGVAGHKAGVDAVRAVVETSAEQGIEVLTLFAFSSENWRRPEIEVNALMQLFIIALEREVKKLHKNNIRLVVMGDKSAFQNKIQTLISDAEQLTKNNDRMTLVIAANYGGQWDIAQAAKRIAQDVEAGKLSADDINEQVFHKYTWLNEFPAPDLMIRTGGEERISNFMLWQTAYSEFYFSDALWPDFKQQEYKKALAAFANRIRRFGRTDDQLTEG